MVCDIQIFIRRSCPVGICILDKVAAPAEKVLVVDCIDGSIADSLLLCGNANLFQVHECGSCGDVELHDAGMGNDFGANIPQ